MIFTKKSIILTISVLAYAYFVKEYIVLMLLLALCLCGLNDMRKKWAVTLGIILLSICFFLLKSDTIGFKLPLGYSVFAFSGISLLIDTSRENYKHSVIDQLCYLFFIPKIFAGPIIRPNDFMSQLDNIFRSSRSELYLACKLLIYSGFCKFIVADNLVQDNMLDSLQGVELSAASLAYGIRFFIDFYAYSIMAVAIALLVGVKLPYNFCNPYHSTSFKDFWKRWNITLSEWLRDYIYFPLGGSKKSRFFTTINILCVFIVSALWHGMTVPFIIWGVMHAFFLIIEKFMHFNTSWLYRSFVVIVCCMMWQLFRFETVEDVGEYGKDLFTLAEIRSPSVFIVLVLSTLFVWIIALPSFEKYIFTNTNNKREVYVEVAICALMLTALFLFPGQANFNFFYMQY